MPFHLMTKVCSCSGHNYMFFESSGPLRGYKRSLHEGGVRSPLLVRWVSVEQKGDLPCVMFF